MHKILAYNNMHYSFCILCILISYIQFHFIHCILLHMSVYEMSRACEMWGYICIGVVNNYGINNNRGMNIMGYKYRGLLYRGTITLYISTFILGMDRVNTIYHNTN